MTKLQQILIEEISSTKDERILQEVNRLLETGVEEEVYQLSLEQIAGIEEAKQQIKGGQFLTNEEANEGVQEWLKRR